MPNRKQSLFTLYQVRTGGRTIVPSLRVPDLSIRSITGYQPPGIKKYWK